MQNDVLVLENEFINPVK